MAITTHQNLSAGNCLEPPKENHDSNAAKQTVTLEMEILKLFCHSSRSPDNAEFGHFTLYVLQRTSKKCTKNYNALA